MNCRGGILLHRLPCAVFERKSGVAKSVQPVLITSGGVKDGKYKGNIVCQVTADDFFAD